MRHSVVALLAGALGFGAVQVASAADMPTKAPMMAPLAVAYNWTGIYVGVNGGGGWGHSDWAYAISGADAGHRNSGGLFGGTIGFNYQMPNNWVLGVEGDWDWADIRGSASCPSPTFSCETQLRSLGTLRARGGYAINNLLLYVTGGVAWGSERVQTVFTPGGAIPPSGTSTNGTTTTNAGWTAGFGAEYGLWNNWSVKAEYLYADLGRHTYTVDNLLQVNSRQRESILRAGLNYRFNWMHP
jgi:outer membrane immunogenic protein